MLDMAFFLDRENRRIDHMMKVKANLRQVAQRQAMKIEARILKEQMQDESKNRIKEEVRKRYVHCLITNR